MVLILLEYRMSIRSFRIIQTMYCILTVFGLSFALDSKIKIEISIQCSIFMKL